MSPRRTGRAHRQGSCEGPAERSTRRRRPTLTISTWTPSQGVSGIQKCRESWSWRPSPRFPAVPSPSTRKGKLGRSTYYLDLSVLPDLVDLDLLRVGQGVVQGLRRGLLQLTGGRRRAHHGLCGEMHTSLSCQPGAEPELPAWGRAHLCLPLPPATLPPEMKGEPSFLDFQCAAS